MDQERKGKGKVVGGITPPYHRLPVIRRLPDMVGLRIQLAQAGLEKEQVEFRKRTLEGREPPDTAVEVIWWRSRGRR